MFSRNLFPANLIQACFQQIATVFVKKRTKQVATVVFNQTFYPTAPSWLGFSAPVESQGRLDWKRTLQPMEGMNVVGRYWRVAVGSLLQPMEGRNVVGRYWRVAVGSLLQTMEGRNVVGRYWRVAVGSLLQTMEGRNVVGRYWRVAVGSLL